MTESPASHSRCLACLLPDLRAFGRFLARDTALADDLVQEAVLRAFRAEAQWDAGNQPPGMGVSYSAERLPGTIRRRGTERRALERMPPQDEAGPSPQDGHGEIDDLGRALQALPLPQREALILVGAHGLSHDEAAIIVGRRWVR
jgi:RNA polymerase sigma-70 factor (ECF subfamily)